MRSSLFRDTLHSFGTSILLIPIGMLVSILMARLLGPENKGGYDLFVSTTTLLVMVVSYSLPVGVTYVAARSNASLVLMFRWLVLIAMGQCLLAALLLGIVQLSGLTNIFLPRNSGSAMVVSGSLYVVLTILASYWRAILIGRQKIVIANWIGLVTRLADLLLLMALAGALYFAGSTFHLGTALGLLLLSAAVSNVLFLRALVGLPMTRSGTDGIAQVIRFSAPNYVGNLIQFLNYRLDMFLVNAIIGQMAVGLYALAVSLAQMLWLLSGAVGTALLPQVASQQHRAAQTAQQSVRAARLTFWATVGGGILFSLLVIAALPWVYGESFRDSIIPFLWLMPGIIAIGPASILATHIAGMGKPQINLYIATVALMATVLLDFVLIPRIGIIGAAMASTVSYSVSSVLTVWLFERATGIPVRDIVMLTPGDMELILSLPRAFVKRARPEPKLN